MFQIDGITITGEFPSKCYECQFFNWASDYLDQKCIIFPWRFLKYPDETIPDWCPLNMRKAEKEEGSEG